MNALTGEVLTLPKISGSVSMPKSLSGNVGAKYIIARLIEYSKKN